MSSKPVIVFMDMWAKSIETGEYPLLLDDRLIFFSQHSPWDELPEEIKERMIILPKSAIEEGGQKTIKIPNESEGFDEREICWIYDSTDIDHFYENYGENITEIIINSDKEYLKYREVIEEEMFKKFERSPQGICDLCINQGRFPEHTDIKKYLFSENGEREDCYCKINAPEWKIRQFAIFNTIKRTQFIIDEYYLRDMSEIFSNNPCNSYQSKRIKKK